MLQRTNGLLVEQIQGKVVPADHDVTSFCEPSRDLFSCIGQYQQPKHLDIAGGLGAAQKAPASPFFLAELNSKKGPKFKT